MDPTLEIKREGDRVSMNVVNPLVINGCLGSSLNIMSQAQSNGHNQAVDLSHHLNVKSKSRHPSPLKTIIKFMGQEGMVSLAGGLPHPSLFPIHKATFTASDPSQSTEIELPLANGENTLLKLADFLQYGTGAGNAQLRQWCHDFTTQVHKPAYSNYEIMLHPGNTNAWSKVVGLLCEEGDYILCESYTYPSAQAFWIPLGNYAAPVDIDRDGMRDDCLEDTLSTWEEKHPGVRRPHVVYLVTVGSNPSGVTMSASRREKIYEICVKYDVIIVEDDPYFFIQYPDYIIGETGPAPSISSEPLGTQSFLDSLAPSFLQYDRQGRVIRLESFSKTLSPGLRLGYFIANPLFTERLLRATEVETQDPAGLSQALTLALFQNWGIDGYILWLQNLRTEYHRRRNWMIDAFAQHFTLVPASEIEPSLQGAPEGVVAALLNSTPIFSFVPPTGGMFIWAKFYLAANPGFQVVKEDETVDDPEQIFAEKLWAEFAEELVLLTPGSYYHPWQGKDKEGTGARGAERDVTNFRFAFLWIERGNGAGNSTASQGGEKILGGVGERLPSWLFYACEALEILTLLLASWARDHLLHVQYVSHGTN
ncbi:pyridoxal phosphate-dependent transferase [Aspergillus californicus]